MFCDICKIPESVLIETDTGVKIFPGSEKIVYDDIVFTFDCGKTSLTSLTTGVKKITLSWKHTFAPDAVFQGDAFERAYGTLCFAPADDDRILPWYFIFKSGDKTGFCGVKTLPDAICWFRVKKECVELVLDCSNYKTGVLPGGKIIHPAIIVCNEYEGLSLYESATEACREMVTKAVFPKNVVYGFNNWYYAYGNSSAEEIAGNSAHLARVTKGLENRPYMVIDDCWQKYRCEEYIGGPWTESNEKFGDMKALADRIKADGNKPGIWIRPLQSRDEKVTPDMYFDDSDDLLDASDKRVLDLITDDVRTITSWGYELIKYDFVTNDITGAWGADMKDGFPADRDAGFKDKSLTTAQIIKNLYKTIYDAADGKAVLIGCNTVGHLGTGYMEIARTGDDTSGYEFSRTKKMGVNTLAFRMCQNGIFFMADADCAGLTKHIPWEKNRQWLEVLATSGTPLFVSVAPDTLDDEQNEFLAEMMKAASVPRKQSEPLDWESEMYPKKWLTFEGEKEFNWD